MKKEYQVHDLFHNSWNALSGKKHALVYALQTKIKQVEVGSFEYGILVISILRALRKQPLLVDKIRREEVALDCYNQLVNEFLNEPWYYFPILKNWVAPADKMAKCSFDQFIYADNEFTSYLVNDDIKFLKRLTVTLYSKSLDQFFDKEKVDERSREIVLHEYEMQLIFYTYLQVRNFVVDRCKNLLPQSKEKGEMKNSGPMWTEIKHAAARTLVFGTFESLGRATMYDVLDHLEILSKEEEHAKP